MGTRIFSSKLLLRRDHEKHLLEVATRIVHLYEAIGLSSDKPDMESLMSMTLQQVFGLCELGLRPHYKLPGTYKVYMGRDDLPREYETMLKELAPLLRAGSRLVTYDSEDEDCKVEYVLSRGHVWLWRDRHKIVFTGARNEL